MTAERLKQIERMMDAWFEQLLWADDRRLPADERVMAIVELLAEVRACHKMIERLNAGVRSLEEAMDRLEAKHGLWKHPDSGQSKEGA